MRKHPISGDWMLHTGIDIAGQGCGAPIYAAHAGTVDLRRLERHAGQLRRRSTTATAPPPATPTCPRRHRGRASAKRSTPASPSRKVGTTGDVDRMPPALHRPRQRQHHRPGAVHAQPGDHPWLTRKTPARSAPRRSAAGGRRPPPSSPSPRPSRSPPRAACRRWHPRAPTTRPGRTCRRRSGTRRPRRPRSRRSKQLVSELQAQADALGQGRAGAGGGRPPRPGRPAGRRGQDRAPRRPARRRPGACRLVGEARRQPRRPTRPQRRRRRQHHARVLVGDGWRPPAVAARHDVEAHRVVDRSCRAGDLRQAHRRVAHRGGGGRGDRAPLARRRGGSGAVGGGGGGGAAPSSRWPSSPPTARCCTRSSRASRAPRPRSSRRTSKASRPSRQRRCSTPLPQRSRCCRRRRRAAAAGGSSGGGSTGGSLGRLRPDPVASAVAGAIDFAKAQLGERYVLGGMGPDAWDCSGLTKASYASVGVYIGTHCGERPVQHHGAARAGSCRQPAAARRPAVLLDRRIDVGRRSTTSRSTSAAAR